MNYPTRDQAEAMANCLYGTCHHCKADEWCEDIADKRFLGRQFLALYEQIDAKDAEIQRLTDSINNEIAASTDIFDFKDRIIADLLVDNKRLTALVPKSKDCECAWAGEDLNVLTKMTK